MSFVGRVNLVSKLRLGVGSIVKSCSIESTTFVAMRHINTNPSTSSSLPTPTISSSSHQLFSSTGFIRRPYQQLFAHQFATMAAKGVNKMPADVLFQPCLTIEEIQSETKRLMEDVKKKHDAIAAINVNDKNELAKVVNVSSQLSFYFLSDVRKIPQNLIRWSLLSMLSMDLNVAVSTWPTTLLMMPLFAKLRSQLTKNCPTLTLNKGKNSFYLFIPSFIASFNPVCERMFLMLLLPLRIAKS